MCTILCTRIIQGFVWWRSHVSANCEVCTDTFIVVHSTAGFRRICTPTMILCYTTEALAVYFVAHLSNYNLLILEFIITGILVKEIKWVLHKFWRSEFTRMKTILRGQRSMRALPGTRQDCGLQRKRYWGFWLSSGRRVDRWRYRQAQLDLVVTWR